MEKILKPEDGKLGGGTDPGLTPPQKRKKNLISSGEFHKVAKDLTDKIFDLVKIRQDYQFPIVSAGKRVSDTIKYGEHKHLNQASHLMSCI